MNEASEVQSQEWDELEAQAIEVAPAGSRRVLLAGVGSGLVLAASGLFLSDWLEEAEAREGALAGAKGGRRGTNHRGRDQKRTHGDKHKHKKDKDRNNGGNGAPPRGLASPAGPRSCALTVVNESDRAHGCLFYYRTRTGPDSYGLPTTSDMPGLDTDASHRYDPDRERIGVLITKVDGPYDIYVDVRNVSGSLPRASVTAGINIEPQRGIFGATQVPEQNFAEREVKEKKRYVLLRLNDDSLGPQRIEWLLTIR